MAGRFLGFVACLVVFPIMAASIGYVFFDQIPFFVNGLPNMPMDGINTLTWLKMIFIAGVFVFVFACGWNYMVQSSNEQDQVS